MSADVIPSSTSDAVPDARYESGLPRRAYLLMPWGRVGSNLVLDIMSQHPFVTCHNEPLTGIATNSNNVSESQKQWYEQMLRRNSSGIDLVNLSAVSIVDIDWFLERFQQESGTRYVFLSRKNVALVVFSVLKARHYASEHKRLYGKESWAVKKGKEISVCTPLVVDEFKRLLSVARDGQRKLELLFSKLGGLKLYYEDIEIDADMVIREICSHVGLPFFKYETRMVKAIERTYSEEFSGLTELKNFLRKTDLAAHELIEQLA